MDGESIKSLMSLLTLCHFLKTQNSDSECTLINIENSGVAEKVGLNLDPDINIQIAIIDHKFSATGSHIQSATIFSLDASGKIAPIT